METTLDLGPRHRLDDPAVEVVDPAGDLLVPCRGNVSLRAGCERVDDPIEPRVLFGDLQTRGFVSERLGVHGDLLP